MVCKIPRYSLELLTLDVLFFTGYLFEARQLHSFQSGHSPHPCLVYWNVSVHHLLNSGHFFTTHVQVSHDHRIYYTSGYDLRMMPFSLFREVRQRDITKYHIQLSIAILLMLAVSFVMVAFSAEKVVTLYGGCMAVSVLVHYFTLVAVMWMGAEALLMLQKLVYVFYRITTKYIISVSVVCWSKSISNMQLNDYSFLNFVV